MYVDDTHPGQNRFEALAQAPGTPPLSLEPSADALQALVQRLAAADLDSALELSRLLASAQKLGTLAEQMIKGGRTTVAQAWLRRITREVDTLHAEWFRLHASGAPRLLRERRTDTPPSTARTAGH